MTNPNRPMCSVIEEREMPASDNGPLTEAIAMKPTIPHLLSGVCVVLITTAFGGNYKQAAPPQTLTGEITDTLCAPYKSHDHMMEQMKSMGSEKESCIQKCLQLGAKYSLYDASQQKAYKIENPDQVQSFAGHKVRVSGELQKDKLKVTQIEAID
jgi:hypothetical protein